jgi:hypothetical protein
LKQIHKLLALATFHNKSLEGTMGPGEEIESIVKIKTNRQKDKKIKYLKRIEKKGKRRRNQMIPIVTIFQIGKKDCRIKENSLDKKDRVIREGIEEEENRVKPGS